MAGSSTTLIAMGIAAAMLTLGIETNADAQSVSPTFNCNQRLNSAERAICNNDDLAFLDQDMVAVYNQIPQFVSSSQWLQVRNEQLAWLRTRNSCGSNVDCLRRTIGARIDVLNTYLPGDLPDQTYNPPPPPSPNQNGNGGLLGIFGNQGQIGQASSISIADYQCNNGSFITVQYESNGNTTTATILDASGNIRLNQIVSASGSQYSNGDITLSEKGGEINVSQRGFSMNCYEQGE